MKLVRSALEAVQNISSGSTVFIHGGSATPSVLLEAVFENAAKYSSLELVHLHTEGNYPLFPKHIRTANLFVGANLRNRIDHEQIDYLPCFLSEIPQLFRSKLKKIDVAVLHLSAPNEHGYCTLGTSVDIARAAFDMADLVIAQINTNMPKISGDGFLHVDDIDFAIEVDQPLFERKVCLPKAEELSIGKSVASLIEDGACLQAGIGSIPDAVVQCLGNHRNLGVHSEMWSDGILSLIKKGAVNNSLKQLHRGKTVSSFLMGSKELYDFVNDNPSVIQLGADYVNDPNVIARNKKVVAINSAVEIDLSGQVCADSIGPKIISGVGGQMDFMRGAAQSKGGKSILAISSRSKSDSRIVPTLKVGAGVVTTRAHIHYVVTEFGIADLYGATLNERAKRLIQISHPAVQENLDRYWFDFKKRLSSSQ